MKRNFYPAIFTREEIGYSVSFPDLKGVFTEGDTMEEAYEMCVDAIGLYFSSEQELTVIPTTCSLEEIKVTTNQTLVLIEFDREAYLRKHSNQAVKKTLTIPSWLNEMALQKNINFSQTLQDSLKNQLGI